MFVNFGIFLMCVFLSSFHCRWFFYSRVFSIHSKYGYQCIWDLIFADVGCEVKILNDSTSQVVILPLWSSWYRNSIIDISIFVVKCKLLFTLLEVHSYNISILALSTHSNYCRLQVNIFKWLRRQLQQCFEILVWIVRSIVPTFDSSFYSSNVNRVTWSRNSVDTRLRGGNLWIFCRVQHISKVLFWLERCL